MSDINLEQMHSPKDSPGATTTFLYTPTLCDDCNDAMIVPDKKLHASLPNVGVTGAGFRPELNASERRKCPELFPSSAIISLPKALIDRLYRIATGFRSTLNQVCNSSTELAYRSGQEPILWMFLSNSPIVGDPMIYDRVSQLWQGIRFDTSLDQVNCLSRPC